MRFNRLRPYHTRPAQLLQPRLHDVEEIANRPADLNVGEHTVLGLPETHGIDPLPMDPAPAGIPQLSVMSLTSD